MTPNVELTGFTDESFATPISVTTTMTGVDQGFTVKSRITNLDADQRYRYRFFVEDGDGNRVYSHVGFTRTSPSSTGEIRLAVCSCANFSSGFFTLIAISRYSKIFTP